MEGVRCVIEARGAEGGIPSLSNRKGQRDYDKVKYKERNLAEQFWGNLTQSRWVATRHEGLAKLP
jgi:hypothetical protein